MPVIPHMTFLSLYHKLDAETFDTNPRLYLETVRSLRYDWDLNEDQMRDMQLIFNHSSHDEYTLYGPPLLWVVLATGTLVDSNNRNREHPLGKENFTCNMSLSQEDGKELFKLLMDFGADPDMEELAFVDSVRQVLENYNSNTTVGHLLRTNNDEFLHFARECIKDYYVTYD